MFLYFQIPEQVHESYTSQQEDQVPLEVNLSASTEAFPELQPPQAFTSTTPTQESSSFHSNESFPPPPPPQGFSMNGQASPTLPAAPFNGQASPTLPIAPYNGQFSPTLPTAPIPNAQRAPDWGVLDANAVRIENRDLVRIKRKQEEQIHNLVQEVATLGTRCKELESIAQR